SVNAERGQKLIQRHGWPPIAQQTGKVAGMQIKGLDMDDPILKQLMGMGMINQQVIIENKLQAIMQQNYELHEYPIPRLFIVLPKPKRRRDRMTHPLSKQFRLYFLCECGDHTIGAGRGNLPNKIHLAKHGGYDLDQPNEFFQRYGSYVLTMMKFVKYGVMAAGIAVPPLAIFKVVEGIETIQKSLGMTLDKVGSLVDETIKHIQEMEKHTEIGGSATAGPMRLDDIEALEGADLRQLQLYLNEKDKGRVLGDLFRIFTPDGHVKWVCIEHFKENYRKAAMQRFKDIITANGAMFLQDTVMIRLGSTTLANQFYEAMVKAQGVRNLDITLEWDVTLGDLEALESAVTRANILQLEIIQLVLIHGVQLVRAQRRGFFRTITLCQSEEPSKAMPKSRGTERSLDGARNGAWFRGFKYDTIGWVASTHCIVEGLPAIWLASKLLTVLRIYRGTSCQSWKTLGCSTMVFGQYFSAVVVKALDFSILRTLYIGKGFSVDDLALLVDRIPLNTNPVDKLDISIMDEPFEAGIRTEWDAHITKLFANRNDSYYWSASRFWAHFANLSRVGAADDTGHDN
ncbi:hypothetical protein B0O80DRAFT_459619, partial [Mortierella sp. GBAus27b]